MVNVHRSIAAEVQMKYISIAVVPPPGAQLAVPATVKVVEELWMLHADHGEEVLIAQVAPEVIFFSEMGDMFRLKEAVVERRATHCLQIQQHHTAVEPGQAIGRGIAHTGFGVFLAILPEGVSTEGGTQRHTIKNKKVIMQEALS